MSNRLQNTAKFIISLVALGLLAFALRDVNLAETLAILLATNIWVLVLILPFQVISIVLRVLRWKYEILPTRNVPSTSLISPLLISYAVGSITVTAVSVLPRVYLANRRTGVDNGFLTGTFVLEYYLDAFTILLWAALIPFFVPLPAEFQQIQVLLVLPLIGFIAVGIALWRRESIVIHRLQRTGMATGIDRVLPAWIKDNLNTFVDGLTASLRRTDTFIAVIGLTVVGWAMEALIFWLFMLSLSVPFSYLQAAAVTAFAYIALGLPSAPGSIGTFDAAVVALFLALGGGEAAALAYVVLLRVADIGPSVIIGIALAWREGWALVNSRSRKAKGE